MTEIKELIEKFNIKANKRLDGYTHTKLGGEAELFFRPKSFEELSNFLKYVGSWKKEIFILGNGSNLIISDEGVEGIVISMSRINNISREGNTIVSQAGAKIINVSAFATCNSLTGLEFSCGIPGSVGGAIYMNAGAYGGEIKDVVTKVKAMDYEGNVVELSGEELNLGYRTSVFQNKELIILEATFELETGNKTEIRKKVNHLTKLREQSQPLEYPSCGSVFKRPKGYYAGKLIRESGLQGFSIGGAEVSKKHSGFIVNKNKATAKDYMELIKHIQNKVKETFGITLETEVKIIGKKEKNK